MTHMLIAAVTAFLAVHPGSLSAQTSTGTKGGATRVIADGGGVFNIVEWDGGELPRLYERSDQLPIGHTDLLRLAENGFQLAQLVEMISQRRYTGDVSADGLIALKRAGLSADVIRAASLHALPPNRSVMLSVTLEFDGRASSPRRRYLYFVIPDGNLERVFKADLSQVFGGRWQSDTTVDRSDILISRPIRTVRFTGRIPMTTPGGKELKVFTSARPDLHWLSELSDADRANTQSLAFEYPASSTRNECRLLIRLFQDRLLEDNWTITETHLECEWN